MFEIIFLFCLGLIWIFFATLQDFRINEIPNWLSFSLICFAMGFRFFYSLFSLGNFNLFYQGFLGLGIFFIIGNIFYYGKLFAGGDAKLLFSLGAVLPYGTSFLANFGNYIFFVMLFLLTGAAYSFLASLMLFIKNYNSSTKEFKKQFKLQKKWLFFSLGLSILFVLLSWIHFYFFLLAILTFILPYLYLYSKAIDEVAMVRMLSVGKLREGDWLYKDLKVGNKTIRANWDGLTKSDIALIRKKYKRVQIRKGVPFTVVFFLSFILFYFFIELLGYSLW